MALTMTTVSIGPEGWLFGSIDVVAANNVDGGDYDNFDYCFFLKQRKVESF